MYYFIYNITLLVVPLTTIGDLQAILTASEAFVYWSIPATDQGKTTYL